LRWNDHGEHWRIPFFAWVDHRLAYGLLVLDVKEGYSKDATLLYHAAQWLTAIFSKDNYPHEAFTAETRTSPVCKSAAVARECLKEFLRELALGEVRDAPPSRHYSRVDESADRDLCFYGVSLRADGKQACIPLYLYTTVAAYVFCECDAPSGKAEPSAWQPLRQRVATIAGAWAYLTALLKPEVNEQEDGKLHPKPAPQRQPASKGQGKAARGSPAPERRSSKGSK
jgi:hypothetical protein